jgi:hypothetical protein
MPDAGANGRFECQFSPMTDGASDLTAVFVNPTIEEACMADESPSLEGLIGSRARDDNGRFISVTPTEEKPAEAPKEPVTAPVIAKTPEPVVTPVTPVAVTPPQPTENVEAAAYKKAMREEREKRQAAEARLRELQTPKEPAVDPWQDLPGALSKQQQTLDERLFAQTCLVSERFARLQHKDYDDVREVFLEEARQRPVLFEQMRQADDPASFAYSEGLRLRELKDVNGDFSAYKSKLEKDIEARLTAQFEAKYGKSTPAVPTSLNSDSSPATATDVYAGPPPLNKILRNARS